MFDLNNKLFPEVLFMANLFSFMKESGSNLICF